MNKRSSRSGNLGEKEQKLHRATAAQVWRFRKIYSPQTNVKANGREANRRSALKIDPLLEAGIMVNLEQALPELCSALLCSALLCFASADEAPEGSISFRVFLRQDN